MPLPQDQQGQDARGETARAGPLPRALQDVESVPIDRYVEEYEYLIEAFEFALKILLCVKRNSYVFMNPRKSTYSSGHPTEEVVTDRPCPIFLV